MSVLFTNFTSAIQYAKLSMKANSVLVPPETHQSINVSMKPEMATYELLNHNLSVVTRTRWDTEEIREAIAPTLPWADDHFKERLDGEPFNPGKTWGYDINGNTQIGRVNQFTHTYMERYWTRYAGLTLDGVIPEVTEPLTLNPNEGIRYELGDLDDLIDLLVRNKLTRQAYLPVFFPEDTGAVHRGSVPSSLGYHFIRRNDQLHVNYYIRSCDLIRHFRNDIYLTVRLTQWIIDQLRKQDPENWAKVMPGKFSMFISSLHMFKNDWFPLFGEKAPLEQTHIIEGQHDTRQQELFSDSDIDTVA